MGHKGVSKRKPKQSKSFSSDSKNPPGLRPGENPSVQSLVKDKTVHIDNANPSEGTHKKPRKGK